MLYYFEAFFQF